MWVFFIPRPMPSKNDRLVNAGTQAQRGRYASTRAKWCTDLHTAMWMAGVPKATGPRRLSIVRLYGKGQRELDDDGPDPKIILDAAKAVIGTKTIGRLRVPMNGAGLIVDDRPGMLELSPITQERAADGRPGVRVEIEDITIEPATSARGQGR